MSRKAISVGEMAAVAVVIDCFLEARREIRWAREGVKLYGIGLKQIVTIRLDTDMLAWYQGAGAGYQARINRMHLTQQHLTLHQHLTQQQGENGGGPNQSNALIN